MRTTTHPARDVHRRAARARGPGTGLRRDLGGSLARGTRLGAFLGIALGLTLSPGAVSSAVARAAPAPLRGEASPMRPGAGATDTTACPVLFVRSGRKADPFLDVDSLADGSVETIPLGAGSGILTALVPMGPGVQRRVVPARPHPGATLSVRCLQGRLSVLYRTAGGRTSRTPAISADSLRHLHLSITMFAAGRPPRGYLLRGGRILAPDPLAPVAPDSGARLPGHVVVTMAVGQPPIGEAIGSMGLRRVGPYFASPILVSGGGTGEAIVDLGTTRTTLSRSLLRTERDTMLTPAAEHVWSPRPGVARALSGPVPRIRHARMAGLRVGRVSFRNTPVNVIPTLPSLEGHEISAIVGTDLLARADVLRIHPPSGADAGTVELLSEADADRTAPVADAQVPFVNLAGLIVIPATVDGHLVPLVLDTGSPTTLITPPLAGALGLFPVLAAPTTLSGVDGHEMRAWPDTLEALVIDGRTFSSVPVAVSDLPILHRLGLPESTGLLGQPFLARLAMLEIDWRAGLVRMYRRKDSEPTVP